MASATDQDLELKLRFRRVLFCQGYWSPIEVELSHYEQVGTSFKRKSLTDLDVLGIKYDPMFVAFRAVADCKSGRKVSDANRLFWLKGVKEYFGADEAYFIHTAVDNHARGLAPKLDVRVLDEEGLLLLEKSLGVEKFPFPIADVSTHVSVSAMWGIHVPKGQEPSDEEMALKDVYSFLSYYYWYMEQHRNLLNLINHFARVAPMLQPGNASHVLLAYVGLERFVHSIMEAASYVAAQGGTNIPRDFRHYLFGGPLSLREREAFIQLLRKLTRSNEQLDPTFLPDLLEFLGRLLRNPIGASDVLRHLTAIHLWREHLKKDNLPPLSDGGQNTAAIVLARDAAKTFSTATGIKEALFSGISSL